MKKLLLTFALVVIEVLPILAQGPVLSQQIGLTLSYEDLGDWLRRYPGMYVQDYGVMGAPSLIRPWGLMPWELDVRKDGIPQSRVSDGLFDSNLLPASELDSMSYRLSEGRGGGAFSLWTRTIPTDSPYTELQIREGYYNFGSVDLAHGQPIYGRSVLELTGRLVWYDGLRQGVSDSRFNRLRGRYNFHLGSKLKSALSYSGSSVQANSELEDRGLRVEREEEGVLTVSADDSVRLSLNPKCSVYVRRDRERWNALYNMRELTRGWHLVGDLQRGRNSLSVSHDGSVSDVRYPGIGDYSQTEFEFRALDTYRLGRVTLVGVAGVERADASFVTRKQEFGWLPNGSASGEVSLVPDWTYLISIAHSESAVPVAWRGAEYRIADRPLMIAEPFADTSRYYVAGAAGITPGGVDRYLKSSTGMRWRHGTASIEARILSIVLPGEFSNQFVVSGDSVTLAFAKGGSGNRVGVSNDMDVPLRWGLRLQSWMFTELDNDDFSRALETRGFSRLYFEHNFFHAPLIVRSHVSYEHLGRRRAVSDRADQLLGPTHLVGFRVSATIHGVSLLWGVDNLLAEHYYIMPGYLMIRKEEYLGVQWRLWL